MSRVVILRIMFGINLKVTLLFSVVIMVVQGNVFRKTKYLQDNTFELDQSSYSNLMRSDNSGSVLKSDFDVWELHKRLYPWRVNRAERIAQYEKFSEQELHIPVAQLEKCQNLKGLPKPESGCCGVELPIFPGRHNNLHYPTGWLGSKYGRNRRSAGSSIAPAKMIKRGLTIEPQRLPWMIRLIIEPIETPLLHSPEACGGTIISSRYVLTAAHCLDDYKDLSQLQVFLAEYDLYSFPNDCINEGKCVKNKVMTVDHVIIHKDYNNTLLQNDIALLRLSSDIPYTNFIRPICLPAADIEDYKDKNLVIGGWGLNGQQDSSLKKAAFINYVANDKCKAQYDYKDDSKFCGIGKHGEDICHGDSGGPLMVFKNNKYFLSGIASGKRKDRECGSSLSSLYSNVFYHKDWIIKHVKL